MAKFCEVTAFAKKHTQGKGGNLHPFSLDQRTRRAEAERNREGKLLKDQDIGWRVAWRGIHAGE